MMGCDSPTGINDAESSNGADCPRLDEAIAALSSDSTFYFRRLKRNGGRYADSDGVHMAITMTSGFFQPKGVDDKDTDVSYS